ncbi:restriction endonuclease [Paenibacillus sp. YPG26]|uniref:restriction endonuclease n=1 Tax=Paenibacillus sp. YPG26 TaxID=2878915 RepID=UPI00203CC42C|nr:restriction endonuclease [Paenibacillus sp. YPG26]USB33956.1 restriction endonuclease [Paenibacillus sp. YPG26]
MFGSIELYAGVLIALFLAGFVIRILLRRRSIYTRKGIIDPLKVSIKDIDKMEDGKEFEEYLYRLFLALGYEDTYKTVSSRDFGADLVFTDRDGERNVIQAKRYAESNPVGLSAVQEIYSSMRYYGASKSIVIASSRYTEACEILAGYNGVKLIDRSGLVEIIQLFKSNQITSVMEMIEDEPEFILDLEERPPVGSRKVRLSSRERDG